MLNIISGILIFIGCSTLGFIYSDRIKDKQKVLVDFKHCIENLKLNIEYAQVPLPKALCECISEGCGGEVKELLESVSLRLEENTCDYASVWENEVERICSKKGVICRADGEDIKLIINFFKRLGTMDVRTQLSSFEMIIETLGRRIDEIAPEVKSKSKMYKQAGVLAGLMIVVVLI